MELDKLKSPCDGCEGSAKYQCPNLKTCDIYRAWFRNVMDTIRNILLIDKIGRPVMKKCVTCKHGVFVELWGEWKCRKFEKTCYNKDSYYDHCKEYIKKGQKEETDD